MYYPKFQELKIILIKNLLLLKYLHNTVFLPPDDIKISLSQILSLRVKEFAGGARGGKRTLPTRCFRHALRNVFDFSVFRVIIYHYKKYLEKQEKTEEMAEPEKVTPMMKQYLRVKAETPEDSILMFRMGDFYEMFFDDAKRAAPALDVVLTKRAGYDMCGVPYHALDTYLPRLIEAGFKVAVAEQMEDPATVKGRCVERAVTRIITPGTIMDGSILKPGINNFLCSLACDGKGRYGLSWLDISTGEFKTEELNTARAVESELTLIKPRECVVSRAVNELFAKTPELKPQLSWELLYTPLDDWVFSFDNASELLKRQFGVISLDGFGLREKEYAVKSAGAVLYYASENLRSSIGHIRSIQLNECADYLGLDPVCQRNLELVEPLHGTSKAHTLLGILDRTRTAMGSRLMREWILRPLRDAEKIKARQDALELLSGEVSLLCEIREHLGGVRDMERIVSRLNANCANPRDMAALAASIELLPLLKDILSRFDLPLLHELDSAISAMPELPERIFKALNDEPPVSITDGNVIRGGYCEELDILRSAATDGKKWVASLQAQEQERTGIKTLKVHFNKVFGYYIEISKSNLGNVPSDYMRKQTLANGERFITPELKEMESRILGSEDKSKALEQKLFEELREFARTYTARIQASSGAAAVLDVLCSLAECARRYRYTRPVVDSTDMFLIRGGRHPVLDATMEGERFVPNDTLLDGADNRMMIITGPNMAGKSTYIRQTALLAIMAQMGSFIPAESAHIGMADRIFTRVGAMDDISRGQSTFMVEMVETANILNHATASSIVILDEIGRGTSTFDGLSIAWSVAEHLLTSTRCRTQFATHYHELTELALTRRGVKNCNVAVREYGDRIIFLRQIIPGGADKSYGIHVARLAGLPEDVLTRADEILENLESNAVSYSGDVALTRRKGSQKQMRILKDDDGPVQLSLFGGD